MNILLVEDEDTLRLPLQERLREEGHEVVALSDGASARAWLDNKRCDLVLTDVRLPGVDGLEVLRRARALDPPAEVLMMTGYASVEQAVEAMRDGAHGYLQKPFPPEALLGQICRIAEWQEMRRRLAGLDPSDDLGLEGRGPEIQALRSSVRTAAQQQATVLLLGESGTGKGRVADVLHRLSSRSAEPFVAVPCGGLTPGLAEGELFGFRRGAFTGADHDQEGLLASARSGTLLLDDVDDLPLDVQATLLRVLEERELRPVGGDGVLPFSAVVISAAKRNLEEMVAEGSFRKDLDYRLAAVPIFLPPWRSRRKDIPDLVGSFLREFAPGRGHDLSPPAWTRLAEHDWPGNLRELRNAVQRATALAGRARILQASHFFPSGILAEGSVGGAETLRVAVRRAEAEAIRSALAATGGRKGETAERLGVSRKALWQKIRDLGLES